MNLTQPADTMAAPPKATAEAVARDNRAASIAPSLVSGCAAAFEFACLALVGTGLMSLFLTNGGSSSLLVPVGTAILAIILAQLLGANAVSMLRRHTDRLAKLLLAWSIVFGIVSVLLIVGDYVPDVKRLWFLVWYVAGVVVLGGASAITAIATRRLTRAGRLQRRAVIVGGGALAESLITALEETGGNELAILGIFDDRNDDRSPESQQGFPKLGTVSDLVDFARVAAVDMVIVALPSTAEVRILQLLKKLWVLPVDIRLAAHSSKLRLRPRSYSYIGRVPFLDLFDRPITGWSQVSKRIFDLVIASLAIVCLSPVFIGTALAVKLTSKGPILFRQQRYGFNNEVISVMKFRSMYADQSDFKAEKVVTRGDPRVTSVGRFIRKTSIDELPQLFNVLKGDLSLVGPRPHAVNAHTEHKLWEEVVDGYFARHKVKPGVTGWAQINGLRGEVDTPHKIQARVEHDLYYIENWSVLFDLYILMLTPIRILNQENAY